MSDPRKVGSQLLKIDSSESPWVAAIIFGAFTIVSAILALTLPETKNLPLSQTLDEAELRFSQQKR